MEDAVEAALAGATGVTDASATETENKIKEEPGEMADDAPEEDTDDVGPSPIDQLDASRKL